MLKFVLVCSVVSFSVVCSAAPIKQENVGLFQCNKLSASFCDPQFGCQLDSQADTCYFDSALPKAAINCTQSLIDVSLKNKITTHMRIYLLKIILRCCFHK